jgi:hypothetical protein
VTTAVTAVMAIVTLFFNYDITQKSGIILTLLVLLGAYLVFYTVRKRKVVQNPTVIKKFIDNSKKKGYNKTQIRKALLDKGWPKKMVDGSLK